jgi:hypothetical protein
VTSGRVRALEAQERRVDKAFANASGEGASSWREERRSAKASTAVNGGGGDVARVDAAWRETLDSRPAR